MDSVRGWWILSVRGRQLEPLPPKSSEGECHVHSPSSGGLPVRCYWTVTAPFMFMARCGVQWNSYLPGLMPANETV